MWHLHICLLGINLALPESEREQSERLNGDPPADLTVSRPSATLTLDASAPSISAQQLLRHCAAAPLGDAAPLYAVASSPAPVTSAPLCERARRERTGVLLS